jgi:hypothetical protein
VLVDHRIAFYSQRIVRSDARRISSAARNHLDVSIASIGVGSDAAEDCASQTASAGTSTFTASETAGLVFALDQSTLFKAEICL